jgi:CubicO group peptidase (beta-lactamase class C family)
MAHGRPIRLRTTGSLVFATVILVLVALAAMGGRAGVASGRDLSGPAPVPASASSQATAVATPAPADVEARVDRLFAKWTAATPGCAVGVSVDGRPALAKAYGMADLEHDVRNAPETIFEAGSVSKQFTAAAVLLLARDGKLSLDDPVRKYLPEVPDFAAIDRAHAGDGSPMTIRHMLTHTSGLRDWGSVAGIAGWPRTTRAYTHAHVLDIVSRQRALNFTPGTRWSYSNTGYNLAAIIVSRVSGMSFAEFTRTRIFEPLGMTRTSWRDDYTRIVKGRAIAYETGPDGVHMLMPFENVHGNGGLLTTVGDLLKWNENFVSPKVGDAAFVAQQQQAGRFTDGRPHRYAFGLMLADHKGVREVGHSGATAGYRADLVRFPEAHLSIAVLCNGDTGAAVQYAHEIADIYLGDRAGAKPGPVSTFALNPEQVSAFEGLYRNTATGSLIRFARGRSGSERDGSVRIVNGPAMIAVSASRLATADGVTWDIDGGGTGRLADPLGANDAYERMASVTPTADQLEPFTGTYVSDEAETAVTVVRDGASLMVKRRPDAVLRLTPLYADAFSNPELGTVVFRRDAGGRPTQISVIQERVWDLRFTRQP